MGSEISYDGQGNIKLAEFTGELNSNCEIDWDDGDVWVRHDGPTICSNEDAIPCEDKWPAKRCNKEEKPMWKNEGNRVLPTDLWLM